jgi:hypothetical protein
LLTNDNKHDSVQLFRVVPNKGKWVLSMILPRVVFQDTASDCECGQITARLHALPIVRLLASELKIIGNGQKTNDGAWMT